MCIAEFRSFKTLLLIFLYFLGVLPAHAIQQLEELSLEELINVKIIGASKYAQNPREVAAATSVITRKDIRAYGWRTLQEALASLPGIYGTYDHQYDFLGTRGGGILGDFNTRVLITINGNRINDATYDQGPTGRDFPLDIDLIERIEFIPGPGSAVYGQNAMLGVVNIITRNGSDIKGVELSAAYQTAETQIQERITMGKAFNNGLDALVSFAGLQSSGQDLFFQYGDTGISGVARNQNGENLEQVFARATYGPLAFDFNYGDRKKQDPAGTYLSDPLIQGQFQRDRRLNTQIQYNDNFANDKLNVTGRLFLGHYDYHSLLLYEGQKTLSVGPSSWHGAELRLLSTHWTDHKVMFGVEYQNNTRIKQTYQNFDNPDENLAIHNSVVRIGVYAQDEWRINPSLSATLGLRYDYNAWVGSRLSPRGALIWNATPKTTLKALYGRAHRSPNSFERDFNDGITQVDNPGLHSEAIDTLEFVADYYPQSDMNIRATVYAWNMDNLITLGIDPVSGLSQYQQSANKILARGAELSFDKSWRWGARVRGSYGLQSAEQKDAHIVNSPYHLGKLNATIPIPLVSGLRAGYELQYYGKRLTLDGSHTKGYFLSNLSLLTNVRWVKGLEASLSIYNVFDAHYQHPAADINWQNALGQLGRTVRFRLEYRF